MEINKIVVHCSASPQGRGDDALTIHRWHQDRGWAGIGYHHVILETGTIENGRPWFWPGAHVRGHNTGSIGICLIGEDGFPPIQMSKLYDLIQMYKIRFPEAELYGHCDLDPNKTCPNFDVKRWWNAFRRDGD